MHSNENQGRLLQTMTIPWDHEEYVDPEYCRTHFPRLSKAARRVPASQLNTLTPYYNKEQWNNMNITISHSNRILAFDSFEQYDDGIIDVILDELDSENLWMMLNIHGMQQWVCGDWLVIVS